MSIRSPRRALFATTLATLLAAISGWSAAAGLPPGSVAIVDTPGPGGVFGTNGFDVFRDQRVAARFTVPAGADMRFLRVGLWLMNNSGETRAKFGVSLQTDALDEGGAASLPSGRDLEHWTARVGTYGWTPVEQFFGTTSAPLLQAGRSYWVVVASNAPALVDPVWTFARKGTMVTTTTFGGAWQPAGSGGALTMRVDALPVGTSGPAN